MQFQVWSHLICKYIFDFDGRSSLLSIPQPFSTNQNIYLFIGIKNKTIGLPVCAELMNMTF